jgi:lysophospholipase L1-like esterase
MKTWLTRWLVISTIFAWAVSIAVLAAEKKPPQDDAEARWKRFEPEFVAFGEADRATPPVQGKILFVGSSIFRKWTSVTEQMEPLPVLNRAFGGSRTPDQLARFAQVVTPYAPKVIVYYCGSNDLKAGAVVENPSAIFSRFREFSERVRAAQPATRIIFVSSTRSPDRVERWEQVDHYNALARAYCSATPHHAFVDINPTLVDRNGHPRLDLYLADKLHFHPPAYLDFTRVIKPVLTRMWAEVEAETAAKTAAR